MEKNEDGSLGISRRLVAVEYSSEFAVASRIEKERLPRVVEPFHLLVRVVYAGVNAGYDTLACEGRLDFLPGSKPGDRSPRPWNLGVEAAGTVCRVGEGVDFQEGDPVATVKLGAGYREHVVLHVRDAIRISTLSRDVVSLLPSAYSALLGLEVIGEVKSDDVVLVSAGAGALGGYLVQLAKLAGCHVIATCSSQPKKDYLCSIGCDRIILYKEEDIDQILSAEYPKGVDVAFDSVGGTMFQTCVKHIAVKGRVVVAGAFSEYGAISNENVGQDISDRHMNTHLLFRSASVRGFVMSHFLAEMPQFREKALKMWELGTLKATVDQRSDEFIGLESVHRAVAYHRSGSNIGKVVVTISRPETSSALAKLS